MDKTLKIVKKTKPNDCRQKDRRQAAIWVFLADQKKCDAKDYDLFYHVKLLHHYNHVYNTSLKIYETSSGQITMRGQYVIYFDIKEHSRGQIQHNPAHPSLAVGFFSLTLCCVGPPMVEVERCSSFVAILTILLNMWNP